MAVEKGDNQSIMTHGWWITSGGGCDYPDESDVRVGVQYANETKTGTLGCSSYNVRHAVVSKTVKHKVTQS